MMYLIGTNIINIISLNVLISIVTDNYNKVMVRIDAMDLRRQARHLLSYERLLYTKRDSGYPQYLFCIKYKMVGQQNLTDSQKWNERFRDVKKEIKKVNQGIEERLSNEIQDVQDDVQKILHLL